MADQLLVDAVKYAVSRDVVPSEEYYNNMTAVQRRQAVSIAGLAQADQIKLVIDKVNKALASGQSFEDFQKSVKETDVELPEHRLRTIYTTNIQQAYAHGRWVQQQRDKRKKPFLKRIEKVDSRTRSHHRGKPLNGLTRPINDPIWQHFYAPDEINCRGVMRALTRAEAEREGLTPRSEMPDVADSSGWGTPATYNRRLDRLVADKVSELMLSFFRQASAISKISARITGAITAFLAQPVDKLADLLAAAKEDNDEH